MVWLVLGEEDHGPALAYSVVGPSQAASLAVRCAFRLLGAGDAAELVAELVGGGGGVVRHDHCRGVASGVGGIGLGYGLAAGQDRDAAPRVAGHIPPGVGVGPSGAGAGALASSDSSGKLSRRFGGARIARYVEA